MYKWQDCKTMIYMKYVAFILDVFLTDYFADSLTFFYKISCLVDNEDEIGKEHGNGKVPHDSGVMIKKLIVFRVDKNCCQ